MVAAVRAGQSKRAVARRFGVSLNTVRRWVDHAAGRRLDRVDWSDSSGGRRIAQATPAGMEGLILEVRAHLRDHSDLGEFGAQAIHRHLIERHVPGTPSVRTIGRILGRHGVLDGQRRQRRSPPPKGWYLPDVGAQRAELDSFDLVEGLVIRGGIQVEVLNGISLHGGLTMSCISNNWTARKTLQSLVDHWRGHGLPDYAQFDNGTVFQGTHRWPDSFGRVIRLCLQLDITPVFAPPREHGFQAAIESYNNRWQTKVWNRFEHADRDALIQVSDRYVAACHQRAASRIEAAPERRPFPDPWQLDLGLPLAGTVIYLRRTDEQGRVHLLGRTYPVCSNWCHRLTRCEVDLTAGQIRIHRLRRRDPADQPLLRTIDYQPPDQPFTD